MFTSSWLWSNRAWKVSLRGVPRLQYSLYLQHYRAIALVHVSTDSWVDIRPRHSCCTIFLSVDCVRGSHTHKYRLVMVAARWHESHAPPTTTVRAYIIISDVEVTIFHRVAVTCTGKLKGFHARYSCVLPGSLTISSYIYGHICAM